VLLYAADDHDRNNDDEDSRRKDTNRFRNLPYLMYGIRLLPTHDSSELTTLAIAERTRESRDTQVDSSNRRVTV
jgi:hypothetical protein